VKEKAMKNIRNSLLFFCFVGTLAAQPTITGVNAFWWLGSGILSDGGTCSGQTGPCYYAQAAWTANANGATGTPTWHVGTVAGGGSVNLSCYTCANTTATSTAPSNGCTYDITVYVTYPDGSQSANFYVSIVTPKNTTLLSGYPTDAAWNTGFVSTTGWNLTDTCGYSDAGLDGNETFGTWTNDTANNWSLPTATATYNASSNWYDQLGAYGFTTPPPENPQSPLTNVKVMHDYPWNLWVGSQTFGSGVSVRADTQQFYQDHGRHQ
jgi:hypothetical protein